MKKIELTNEPDNQLDDWSDESGFYQAEDFGAIEAGDSELDIDTTDVSGKFSASRIKGLTKGLTARRKIERLLDKQALHRQLEEYDDFDFLN